jgi:hypothetical protein
MNSTSQLSVLIANDEAVIAIKDGTYSYVEKPVKPELFKKIVRKALEARELEDATESTFDYSGPLDFDSLKKCLEKEFIINTWPTKICKFDIVVKDFAEEL